MTALDKKREADRRRLFKEQSIPRGQKPATKAKKAKKGTRKEYHLNHASSAPKVGNGYRIERQPDPESPWAVFKRTYSDNDPWEEFIDAFETEPLAEWFVRQCLKDEDDQRRSADDAESD